MDILGGRMKEIIIDGVNVAGCEFYEPKAQVMTCHEESITKRCDKTNCYYKQLQRLKQENAELKAYNERLKEEIKMYKSEDTRKHNVIMETLQCEKKALDVSIKYKQTLQEIKTIAEAPSPYIDNFEIKTATEVGYDYAAICNELELRLHKVLELITKAEEE
jgi:predicted RNase H-like nuclease (RuvC/YqgF family)